ncbi:PDGLE domain-containing protein [Nocardioides sp.]|uniref:PDGLE domain-containing protein n=1 Tax=Nocardioides sp. TaxID=35761 RepID=UPI0035277BAE
MTATPETVRRRVGRRGLLLAGLVLTLLLAGVASFYASSHPDGLEFVAEKTGFSATEKDSAATDSPFADYQTAGIHDRRLGKGLAGVVGVGVVLLVGGGLFWALRRRPAAAPGAGPGPHRDPGSD